MGSKSMAKTMRTWDAVQQRKGKEVIAEILGFMANEEGEVFKSTLEPVKIYQNGYGYLTFTADGHNVLLHRFVWRYFNGPIPPRIVIDHIDGDRGNPKLYNLRLATQSENSKNTLRKRGLHWQDVLTCYK